MELLGGLGKEIRERGGEDDFVGFFCMNEVCGYEVVYSRLIGTLGGGLLRILPFVWSCLFLSNSQLSTVVGVHSFFKSTDHFTQSVPVILVCVGITTRFKLLDFVCCSLLWILLELLSLLRCFVVFIQACFNFVQSFADFFHRVGNVLKCRCKIAGRTDCACGWTVRLGSSSAGSPPPSPAARAPPRCG